MIMLSFFLSWAWLSWAGLLQLQYFIWLVAGGIITWLDPSPSMKVIDLQDRLR